MKTSCICVLWPSTKLRSVKMQKKKKQKHKRARQKNNNDKTNKTTGPIYILPS